MMLVMNEKRNISTYQMNKALQKTGDVAADDFIGAVQEKQVRQKRRKSAYSQLLKRVANDMQEEEKRKVEYRDTLEKHVKFCPKCGYKTVIENHVFICIRKCRQCLWQSKPFRKPNDNNIFS
jgi:NADH pyrophosphatase NudC (nudix superfamily)